MFSKFTRHEGKHTLLVRSDRIISIGDALDGITSAVTWEAAGEIASCTIDGTADENYARLQAEEIAMMDDAQRRQQRADVGLPILPVRRGRL